jgi:hypothetical protein
MTHSVIEDLGTSIRYAYRANHTVTDMMDIYEASDKVFFDSNEGLVVGKEETGTSFTYKIDLPQAFDDFRMKAVQLGDDENKMRLEYSFDNAFWKEVSAIRQDDAYVFDVSSLHNSGNVSTIYVKASYIGSKNASGVFGLSDFSVVATMPKEIAKKLSH